MARELDDADRLARAAMANNRGVTSAFGMVDEDRVEVLEAALEALDATDKLHRARLLALLAVELNFSGDFERRKQLSDDALELARSGDDQRTLAHVLTSRCVAIRAPTRLRSAASTPSS